MIVERSHSSLLDENDKADCLTVSVHCHMKHSKLARSQQGASLVEITILISLIAVISWTSLTQLGDEIQCPLYNANVDENGIIRYQGNSNQHTKKMATKCCIDRGGTGSCIIDTCYCIMDGILPPDDEL